MNAATAAPPRHNLDEIRRALALLIEADAVAELRIVEPGIASGYYNDRAAIVRDAGRGSGKAEGVYITLNPVNPALLARSPNRLRQGAKHTTSDADVRRRTRFLVDLDAVRPAGISSSDEEHSVAIERAQTARAWLGERGWPAPVFADSGNGAHLVYRLDLPNDDATRELVKRCLAALALQFDDEGVTVDCTTHNAARISKVYGTLAAKGADTQERPHRLTRILDAPARLEPVSRELLEALAVMAPPAPQHPGARSGGNRYTLEGITQALDARGLAITKQKAWSGGTLLELAECPWAGAAHSRTARVILHATGAVSAGCFHASCAERGWRELREGLGMAASARQNGRPPDAAGRPEIDTANLGLDDMAGVAWDAIDGANTPPRIFSYAGALAWLVEDASGSANVEVMNQDHVRHHLADVATFIRWSRGGRGRSAEKKRAFPPEALAADLFAVPRPTLPRLQRLVRTPVFTRDGRLLMVPGFDAGSGLYLAPPVGAALPSIPSVPSAAEIDAAREALCVDLLGDFPFVTDADRAHAVALLLTPVLRELIAGCVPLFIVSKPAPRTGAGLLTKVVSIVTGGSPIAATTISRAEEEMRKRLTALLMSSPPMILLDNLHGRLDSAALAAILTTSTWEDRMLGRSQTVRLSVRSAFAVTGNNVALSNEMAGRSVLIRLDPKIEDPSTRTGFLHADLESWAATNRARLLWSALVLGQAWIAAGRPMAAAAFGGFAEWAGVLGGVLRSAGIPGFLLNRRTLFDQADEESAHVRAFLADWWKEHHDDPVVVKALIELARGHPLRIASRSEHGTLIRLGQLVQSLEDRQYNIGDAVVAVRRAGEFRRAVLWRLACESDESCESPSVTARAIAQVKCEVAAAQKDSQDSHTHIGELRV